MLNTYPHDPRAFTQGLVLDGATLYESTGQEGQSSLRRVDLATGRVLQKTDQPSPIFSEGLAVVGPHLIQLTWKNGIAYQYRQEDLRADEGVGLLGRGLGRVLRRQGARHERRIRSAHLSRRGVDEDAARRARHAERHGRSISSTSSSASTAASGPTSGKPTASSASTRAPAASPAIVDAPEPADARRAQPRRRPQRHRVRTRRRRPSSSPASGGRSCSA